MLHVGIKVRVTSDTVAACKTLRRMLVALVKPREVVKRSASKPEIAHNRTNHRKKNNKRSRPRRIPWHMTEDVGKKGAQTKRGVASVRSRVEPGTHALVESTVIPIMCVGADFQQRGCHVLQRATMEKNRPRWPGRAGRQCRMVVRRPVSGERPGPRRPAELDTEPAATVVVVLGVVGHRRERVSKRTAADGG